MLVREFQLDPVTQALLHADFYRVNLERKIAVKVPVVLHGDPKGVKTCGRHPRVPAQGSRGRVPAVTAISSTSTSTWPTSSSARRSTCATWPPTRPGRRSATPTWSLVHIVSLRTAAEPAADGAATPAAAVEPEVAKKGKADKDDDKDKPKK
ncbi:MAG: hypothetical protein R2708_28690 [Vicinamibacterales bacterium]